MQCRLKRQRCSLLFKLQVIETLFRALALIATETDCAPVQLRNISYVNIKNKTHLIGIDEEISKNIAKTAFQENTTTESLVNSWLKEKVSNYAEVK